MFTPRLNKQELGELRAIHEIVRTEKWKLEKVKGNTAFVKGGKKWVETQEDVVKQLERAREDYISDACARRGIDGKVSVSLENGKITKHE